VAVKARLFSDQRMKSGQIICRSDLLSPWKTKNWINEDEVMMNLGCSRPTSMKTQFSTLHNRSRICALPEPVAGKKPLSALLIRLLWAAAQIVTTNRQVASGGTGLAPKSRAKGFTLIELLVVIALKMA
jgi:hypothetical protein